MLTQKYLFFNGKLPLPVVDVARQTGLTELLGPHVAGVLIDLSPVLLHTARQSLQLLPVGLGFIVVFQVVGHKEVVAHITVEPLPGGRPRPGHPTAHRRLKVEQIYSWF